MSLYLIKIIVRHSAPSMAERTLACGSGSLYAISGAEKG